MTDTQENIAIGDNALDILNNNSQENNNVAIGDKTLKDLTTVCGKEHKDTKSLVKIYNEKGWCVPEDEIEVSSQDCNAVGMDSSSGIKRYSNIWMSIGLMMMMLGVQCQQ